MKRTIRLTENELHYLIKESVRKILKENTGNNIITGNNVFRDDNIPNKYNDLSQELDWCNVFEIIDQYYKGPLWTEELNDFVTDNWDILEDNIKVYGNIVYDEGCAGTYYSDSCGSSVSVEYCFIYNRELENLIPHNVLNKIFQILNKLNNLDAEQLLKSDYIEYLIDYNENQDEYEIDDSPYDDY